MSKGKSLISIDHDACDMDKWTLDDWRRLRDFARSGSLTDAAVLARRGVQLLRSDHLVDDGGTLEHVGWAQTDVAGKPDYDDWSDDFADLDLDAAEINEVVPLLRGPTRYVVPYGVGDTDGNYEGTEHEVFEDRSDADRFVRKLREIPQKEQT